MRSIQTIPILFVFLVSATLAGCARGYHTFADYPGFAEYYAERCREEPPPLPVKDRALLEKHLPIIVLPPEGQYPVDFYRDYLPFTVLKSFPDDRIVEKDVTRQLLVDHRQDRDVYLDFDRDRFKRAGLERRAGGDPAVSVKERPPVVYGRVYRERVPFPGGEGGTVSRRLTFLKYNFLFPISGLPARLNPPARILTFLAGFDLEDWHELDNFAAVHVVLDEEEDPVAIILAQHNHHRTYLVGRDIFAGENGRFSFDVARRSNELYPASTEPREKRHRVIRWSLYLDYLLSGENGPVLKGWDVTVGVNGGGVPVRCELVTLSPCDPLYTSEMLLGEPRSLFGLYIGRDGPPGSDYYNVPMLLPPGNILKFAYLHEEDPEDIAAVRQAVDRDSKIMDIRFLIDYGGRQFHQDWLHLKQGPERGTKSGRNAPGTNSEE